MEAVKGPSWSVTTYDLTRTREVCVCVLECLGVWMAELHKG